MNLQRTKFFLLICLLSTLFAVNTLAQIPTSGLIAYYPFDTGTNNTVGNTLHATSVGATLGPGRTHTNNCYSFDGINDRITIPSTFDFLPRTVNLWFIAENADYSDWRFIYESDNALLQKGLLELVVREINSQLYLFINAGDCRDTVEINKNQWYNANLYVDASKQMKFHLNGTLVTNKPFTTFLTSVNGSQKVVIGANRFENARLLKGKIDDIAVFNRELTQTEISLIVNPAPPPVPTLDSLVAYYPFNGNAGDSSGNGLHGTTTGVIAAPDRFNIAASSLKFSGSNNFVELPSDFDFVPRTVNLWFKAEQDDYSDWKLIYESDNPTLQKGLLELVLRQEMSQLLLYINAGNCRDTVPVQINTWYNVNLFVDSNKVMKFYLNGVLLSNKTFTSNLTSSNGLNKVLLGTDRNKIGRFFKGQIDDLRFFSYGLSQTEINAIYNQAAPPPPPPVTLNRLVAHYPFNGNAGDSSGNGLHGTISGNVVPAPDRSNKASSSLKFNGGGSYVELPTNFDFAPRTVNFWFKAEQDNYSDWKCIYESDNPALQKGLLGLVLRQEMNQLLLYINAGNCRDTVPVQINTWYNVNLFVDSNKVMKFYLNGVLLSNKTFTSNLTSSNGFNKVLLGTDRNKIGRFFKGQIDDLKFFNYGLSQSQLDSIVNHVPPPPPPTSLDSLVAYYPFNGNAGDSSGNGLHGTISGNVVPAPDRFNNASSSLKFNGGGSYVELPTNFDFAPRTVNFWFKAEQDNYSDWKCIYESDNPALQKGLLSLVLRQEMNQLLLYINAGNCRDTVPVQINTWYNANLFVDSNKVMKFYLNGVLLSNKTFTSNLTSINGFNKVLLGTDRNKLSRFFKGQIDDLKFFNYALSQSQLDSIVNQVPPPPPPTSLDSLIAYYPFNGNAGDSSGNGLHGIITSNVVPAPDRFNNASSSLKFNGGGSYVEFPSNFDFVPRTVNLWFKAEQDNYSDWKCIYESDNPALKNGLLELVLREEMGQLLLYINAGNCRDTVDVLINTWYNANLFVDSNKVMKFYLNGVLLSNKTFTSNLTSMNGINKVILGTDRNKISRFFKGQIDEVKFFSYGLSQNEISNIYNQGVNVCHVTVTDTLIINVNLFNSSPVTFNNTLKIYPNPTKDKINIDCGSNFRSMQNASVRIINALGQAMFESKISQQNFEVDMSTWTGKGLYLVYIIDSKGNINDVRKIVLQ